MSKLPKPPPWSIFPSPATAWTGSHGRTQELAPETAPAPCPTPHWCRIAASIGQEDLLDEPQPLRMPEACICLAPCRPTAWNKLELTGGWHHRLISNAPPALFSGLQADGLKQVIRWCRPLARAQPPATGYHTSGMRRTPKRLGRISESCKPGVARSRRLL